MNVTLVVLIGGLFNENAEGHSSDFTEGVIAEEQVLRACWSQAEGLAGTDGEVDMDLVWAET